MLDEARLKIEAEQEELVEALLLGGKTIPQFDSERLETASSILRKKRIRALKKSWPKLVESLGLQFDQYFSEYASLTSQPKYQASLLDGRLFAQFLESRNLLPESAVPEVENFDLSFVVKSRRICKRGKLDRTFRQFLLRVRVFRFTGLVKRK